MAEPGRKPTQNTITASKTAGDGESISGYFREVFKENSKLLDSRSNQELLDRWLGDHPGQEAMLDRVRTNLPNVKSVLRKKRRKRRGKQPAEAPVEGAVVVARTPISKLEALEEQIDDCLSAWA